MRAYDLPQQASHGLRQEISFAVRFTRAPPSCDAVRDQNMTHLRKHEPKPTEFCLCGSGAAFRVCCHGKYRPTRGIEVYEMLEKGDTAGGVRLSRGHLTWYRLAHMAHTAPFVSSQDPAVLELLDIDIKALEDIAKMLCRCLWAAGIPEHFESVLVSLGIAIDDPRWRDAVFAMRVAHRWEVMGDDDGTWALLASSGEFATTARDDVFKAWLSVAPPSVPLAQKLAVVARLKRNTKASDVLMLCSLVEGAYLALEDAKRGLPILIEGIARYDRVGVAKQTPFGVLKMSQAMAVAGTLKNDPVLLRRSIAAAQRYLAMTKRRASADRGDVLCACGEASIHLGEYPRAISFFETSLNEDPSQPMPSVYLAEAHLRSNNADTARIHLDRAAPHLETAANKMDFAYVAAKLALHSRSESDVTRAREALVSAGKGEGGYEARRVMYLNQLAGLGSQPKANVPGWLKWLKYVKFEPSIYGVGVKVDKLVEEATKRHMKQEK